MRNCFFVLFNGEFLSIYSSSVSPPPTHTQSIHSFFTHLFFFFNFSLFFHLPCFIYLINIILTCFFSHNTITMLRKWCSNSQCNFHRSIILLIVNNVTHKSSTRTWYEMQLVKIISLSAFLIFLLIPHDSFSWSHVACLPVQNHYESSG